MNNKFTPGPWKVEKKVLVTQNGHVICDTRTLWHTHEKNVTDELVSEAEENAKLIASAPSLLRALELIEHEAAVSVNAEVVYILSIVQEAIKRTK